MKIINPIICGWIGRIIVFTVVIVLTIIYTASIMRYPELINKGGASLSAIGALLVIYQALLESKIEKNKETEGVILEKLEPANREIAEKFVKQKATQRKSQRIEIVIAIAIIVCVGEVMHGWGEYMYRGEAGSEHIKHVGEIDHLAEAHALAE
jgi:hypothetical protein